MYARVPVSFPSSIGRAIKARVPLESTEKSVWKRSEKKLHKFASFTFAGVIRIFFEASLPSDYATLLTTEISKEIFIHDRQGVL